MTNEPTSAPPAPDAEQQWAREHAIQTVNAAEVRLMADVPPVSLLRDLWLHKPANMGVAVELREALEDQIAAIEGEDDPVKLKKLRSGFEAAIDEILDRYAADHD
jgi:hypothetical protein